MLFLFEIELTFTQRVAFPKIQDDFQYCHIWAWNLVIEKVPEDACILCTILCLPRWAKLGFSVLCGQRFLRFKQIFIINIFGNWIIWPLTKVPEYALNMPTYMACSYPRVEYHVIFALQAVVLEMQAYFQIRLIWTWTWPLAKFQEIRSILSVSPGSRSQLIFVLWASLSEIQAF